MDKIFVDSSAFSALYNRRDTSHEEAKSKSAQIFAKRLISLTSSYVIDETLSNLLSRSGYKAASQFGKRFFEEEHEIEILRIDEYFEREAWNIFKRFNRDKSWSFTDCTSYVLMKNMGINNVFTFDLHDFRQMGFKIL